MDVNEIRRAATSAAALARTLARLADEAEADAEPAAPEGLAEAMANLGEDHRAALVRVSHEGELAEDSRGRANLWLPIDRAVTAGATTPRGRKRMMNTIGESDELLKGVYWGTDDEGAVWAKVPARTAMYVRQIVSKQSNDSQIGDEPAAMASVSGQSGTVEAEEDHGEFTFGLDLDQDGGV